MFSLGVCARLSGRASGARMRLFLLFLLFFSGVLGAAPACSQCDLVVTNPAQSGGTIDGTGLPPGARICFDTAVVYTKGFVVRDVVGSAQEPIIISQCGPGTARLQMDNRQHALDFRACRDFKVSGCSSLVEQRPPFLEKYLNFVSMPGVWMDWRS